MQLVISISIKLKIVLLWWENKMEIIDVNLDNLDKEHICCALSDKK